MNRTVENEAILALADGTVFKGVGFGVERGDDDPAIGEVVFNTSLMGYQEIITDPSYAGQMLCFTYPHIGNVGCNDEDNESAGVHMEGVIVKQLCREPSNFRAKEDLDSFLRRAGKTGIEGIDTRMLVKHLRDKGSQMGAIASGPNLSVEKLVEKAKAAGSMEGKNYADIVSCKEPYTWNELPWDLETNQFPKLSPQEGWSRPHVVALDCGVKYNILRLLLSVGFRVTVVPSSYTAEQILELAPDGLFVSNGPGDPATLGHIAENVEKLIGRLPIFGICLGHQIIAQAFGGKTYKLKFGHRGGNHPVMDLSTRAVEITVQNHGFAVDSDSLPDGVEISHINLNDNTVEG